MSNHAIRVQSLGSYVCRITARVWVCELRVKCMLHVWSLNVGGCVWMEALVIMCDLFVCAGAQWVRLFSCVSVSPIFRRSVSNCDSFKHTRTDKIWRPLGCKPVIEDRWLLQKKVFKIYCTHTFKMHVPLKSQHLNLMVSTQYLRVSLQTGLISKLSTDQKLIKPLCIYLKLRCLQCFDSTND